MNKAPVNILIDSKCILDYDLTIMKIFQYYYNHPDFVDQKVMQYSLPQLKCALNRRSDTNPLSICVKNMTGDNMQAILDQIYKENDYEIYKHISLTDTADLIEKMITEEAFNVTVVCKNENEMGFIERLFGTKRKLKLDMILGYGKVLNPDDYKAFMFKDIRDVFALPFRLEEKQIFVQNYEFNITRDTDGTPVPRIEYLAALMKDGNNRGLLVEVYKSKSLESIPKEETTE